MYFLSLSTGKKYIGVPLGALAVRKANNLKKASDSRKDFVNTSQKDLTY
jgi:hypothetical protein